MSRRLPSLATRASLALALAAVATLAPARPARACGPDFPISLLHDRADTLGALPESVFATEAAHLVTPAHAYVYVAGDAPAPDDAGTRERALYEAGDYAAVLALPAADRRRRSVRAAYMLGRERDGEAGIAAYRRVRELVLAGFPDDAGLALSSLGQEARLHLRLGDDVGAVRLYAEQAALGHPDGWTSLLFVVRDVVDRGAERALLRDPVGQRLLAVHLESRGLELDDATAARLWRELSAIDDVAGADQLAAFAYQRGEWARAAAFVARAGDAPMAQWVAAKLALRDGDRERADRLLAAAEAGYRARNACSEEPPPAPWTDVVRDAREDLAPPADEAAAAPADEAAAADAEWAAYEATQARLTCEHERHRIVGERAAIAVADGRMADALALAWQVRELHADDLDYIAERLVTLRELEAFVASLPGADAPAVDHVAWESTPAALRALLGRRLMRAGRYAEAIAYLGPSARGPALAFALAITRAGSVDDPFERARALYQASRVCRQDGLEILGTAGAPDWEYYGAQYDRFAWDDERGLFDGRGLFELTRVAASAPARGERYHYRYLASELAERAAALLPPRSQAYTASLCWAAHHVRNDAPARVESLYYLSLRRGAYVEDLDFPSSCPEPDFAAARATSWAPPPAPVYDDGRWHGPFEHGYRRLWLRRLALLGGGFVAVGLLGLAFTASQRRWRRFVPRP